MTATKHRKHKQRRPTKPNEEGRNGARNRFCGARNEKGHTAKTDKEFTVRVLQRFLKTNDREILDKTFDVYKNVQEKIPYPDPKVMGIALRQLSATVPQAAQLKAEDFIHRSIIAELESEGFIAKLYGGR